MPRTGRVVSLTGYNHIIARGNGGICIFEDDEDRYRMLTLFEGKLVGNGVGLRRGASCRTIFISWSMTLTEESHLA